MNVKNATAGQLMTSELITVSPTATLRAAARLFSERHVHCLIVPASDPQRCSGVITIKDIVLVLSRGEPQLLDQLLVQDAMTAPSVSVQKDFSIADCIELMRVSGVRSAPVLDGVRLVGILSFTDIVRAVALDTDAD